MHFPSTYLNYPFLHPEKMPPSLEVFRKRLLRESKKYSKLKTHMPSSVGEGREEASPRLHPKASQKPWAGSPRTSQGCCMSTVSQKGNQAKCPRVERSIQGHSARRGRHREGIPTPGNQSEGRTGSLLATLVLGLQG